MRTSPTLLISLLLLTSCEQKSSSETSSIIESSDSRVVFTVNPGQTQEISSAENASFHPTKITIPSNNFSSSEIVTLTSSFSMTTNYLHRVMGWDQEAKILASGQAFEIRPLNENPRLSSELSITITPPQTEDSSAIDAVIYRGINESATWSWGIIPPASITKNPDGTMTFKTSLLGAFQALKIKPTFTEDPYPLDPGSGDWYGYDFNLLTQFTSPKQGEVNLVYNLFSGKGIIDEFFSNGTEVSPPPSFSFPSLSTDFIGVYDNSGEAQVAPSIFTKDFRYGVQFEARVSEQILTIRHLERYERTTLPSDTVNWEDMVADYKGQTASMKASGDSGAIESASSDKISLSWANNSISMRGSIATKALEAQLTPITSGIAGQLGFAIGDSTLDGTAYQAYLSLSPSRSGLSLVLCKKVSTETCPKGDGSSSSYKASELLYSAFTKDTDYQP